MYASEYNQFQADEFRKEKFHSKPVQFLESFFDSGIFSNTESNSISGPRLEEAKQTKELLERRRCFLL